LSDIPSKTNNHSHRDIIEGVAPSPLISFAPLYEFEEGVESTNDVTTDVDKRHQWYRVGRYYLLSLRRCGA